MDSRWIEKWTTATLIFFALAGMVQLQAARSKYDSKSSLGLGYGLPYGGVGLNYEITLAAPKDFPLLGNLGLSLGIGGAPAGGFSSLTCRYYWIGRSHSYQIQTSLTGIIGYNIEENKIVGDVGIGSGLLLFVNKAISLEAGINFTLFNHELIPIVGIRWNFY